jgi:hypothetical protein
MTDPIRFKVPAPDTERRLYATNGAGWSDYATPADLIAALEQNPELRQEVSRVLDSGWHHHQEMLNRLTTRCRLLTEPSGVDIVERIASKLNTAEARVRELEQDRDRLRRERDEASTALDDITAALGELWPDGVDQPFDRLNQIELLAMMVTEWRPVVDAAKADLDRWRASNVPNWWSPSADFRAAVDALRAQEQAPEPERTCETCQHRCVPPDWEPCSACNRNTESESPIDQWQPRPPAAEPERTCESCRHWDRDRSKVPGWADCTRNPAYRERCYTCDDWQPRPAPESGPAGDGTAGGGDWTAGSDGRANSSMAYSALVVAVAELLGGARLGENQESLARLIVSQLAHKHGVGPLSAARRGGGERLRAAVKRMLRNVEWLDHSQANRRKVRTYDLDKLRAALAATPEPATGERLREAVEALSAKWGREADRLLDSGHRPDLERVRGKELRGAELALQAALAALAATPEPAMGEGLREWDFRERLLALAEKWHSQRVTEMADNYIGNCEEDLRAALAAEPGAGKDGGT